MSINWKDSDWEDAAELANKIYREGGLAEFIMGYGVLGLPKELQYAAEELERVYAEVHNLFVDAGVLL